MALTVLIIFSTWSLVSGQVVYQSPLQKRIERIAVSPDGKIVGAADVEGYVFFWATDGSLRKIVRASQGPITDLTFSADEKYFATTSTDGQFVVWDFSSGDKLGAVTIASNDMFPSFATSGEAVYYAYRDGLFKVSLKESGNVQKVYPTALSCSEESDDGEYLAAAGDGFLRVFSLADGKLMASEQLDCVKISRVEFSGNQIATLCRDGGVHIYGWQGGVLKKIAGGNFASFELRSMIITGAGKVLLAGENEVQQWDPASGKFFSITGLPEDWTALAAAGGRIYAGTRTGKVMVCAVSAAKELPDGGVRPVEKITFERSPEIAVEVTAGGIPASINGRAVQAQQPVWVSSPSLDVYVWDDEREDGDTISLILNGEWILNHYGITAEKKKVSVNLVPDRVNYLVLYAHNLGKFPPNTAVISFNDGKAEKMLTLESDLKRCAAVSFSLLK